MLGVYWPLHSGNFITQCYQGCRVSFMTIKKVSYDNYHSENKNTPVGWRIMHQNFSILCEIKRKNRPERFQYPTTSCKLVN